MRMQLTRRGLFRGAGLVAAAAVVAGTAGQVVRPTEAKAFGWQDDQPVNEDNIAKGREVSAEIEGEGAVLLKNEDNALPLASGAKVTILGSMSYNYVEGGTGSAGGKDDEYTILMNDAFTQAGLDVNSGAWDWLVEQCGGSRNAEDTDPGAVGQGTSQMGGFGPMGGGSQGTWTNYQFIHEFPVDTYEGAKDTILADGYTDTAIVTFSRSGAEGASPSMDADGDGSTLTGTTYLELNDNEKALLAFCKENFGQTIVLVNSAVCMELGFIDSDEYNVTACLWIGHPGEAGLLGVGKILAGEVNPSGRTVDTWAYDMTTNPTYYNTDDNKYTNATIVTGQVGWDPNTESQAFYQYEEGIYVGYRFFETAAAQGYFDSSDFTGHEWKNGKASGYDQVVQFPFGHGLSYTTFTEEVVSSDIKLEPHATNTVNVKVTNTGDVAGKDVVELYMEAPYAQDTDHFGIKGRGLEKAKVVLVAFAKSDELDPGASAEYQLSFTTDDLASFDNFGQGCYVLENGTYKFNVQKDAHQWGDEGSDYAPSGSVSFDLDAPVIYDESGDVPGATYAGARDGDRQVAKNSMDDVTAGDGNMLDGYLSRSDFAAGMKQIMTHQSDETPNEAISDAAKAVLECSGTNSVEYDFQSYVNGSKTSLSSTYYAKGANMMPFASETPDGVDVSSWDFPEWEKTYYVDEDATGDLPTITEDEPANGHKLGLDDMANVPIDTEEGLAIWDALASETTMDEAIEVQGNSGWKSVAIPSLDKPEVSVNDGPGEARNGSRNGNTWWPCAVVLCSTWNPEQTYNYGVQYGVQALDAQEVGAYAPAMNLHRSPFGGRNFEYWSEDGFISGKLAGAAAAGIQSQGVMIFPKHCTMNDGDTNRGGNCTWANEQAIRELYLRPFELTIKEFGAKGIMGSLNRIGLAWFHYGMYETVMRKEWGWQGLLITDGDGNDGDVYNSPQAMLSIDGAILNNGGYINNATTLAAFGDATEYAYGQQCLHDIIRFALYQYAGPTKAVTVHANVPGTGLADDGSGATTTTSAAAGGQGASAASGNATPYVVGGIVAAAAIAGVAVGVNQHNKKAKASVGAPDAPAADAQGGDDEDDEA